MSAMKMSRTLRTVSDEMASVSVDARSATPLGLTRIGAGGGSPPFISRSRRAAPV